MQGDEEAAIYGSILVAALVATLDAEHADARAMIVAVLATMVVFWLAHVWAGINAESVRLGTRVRAGEAMRVARRQWPMIEAALLPTLPLALAWSGAWSLTFGVDLALGLAVVQLVGWGMVAGMRTHARWPRALLSGLVNGALGLAIVALKTLVH